MRTAALNVKQAKRQPPLSHILGVRLDADVIDALATIAQRKGIGPSTLARIWLMEHGLTRSESNRLQKGDPAEASTRLGEGFPLEMKIRMAPERSNESS